MGGELVDLDFAEFADVAYAFVFEGVEVGGYAAGFEVDDAGEGFVEEGTDGLDGEGAGFGLVGGVSDLRSEGDSLNNVQQVCGSWP